MKPESLLAVPVIIDVGIAVREPVLLATVVRWFRSHAVLPGEDETSVGLHALHAAGVVNAHFFVS